MEELKMKAGIYKGIKNVCVEEREKPEAKANDVIIKVVKGGICGTDSGAYLYGGDGVGIHANSEFGHEFVGVIDTVGELVEGISVGDRVTICPTTRRRPDCGLTMAEIADAAGAFSGYVYVEDAKLGYNVFKLPETLSFHKGVLTEPLSVSTHAVARAQLNGNEKVLVYGAGTIGLCAVAALQHVGIKDIIVTDLSDFRLEVARKLGVKTCNSSKEDLLTYVKNEWGTIKGNFLEDCINADVVIDCAGAPVVFDHFMLGGKPNSKLIIVANYGEKTATISPLWFMGKEISIIGSAGYTPADIEESIATLNDPNCKLDEIILQTFKLDEIKEAFETAIDTTKSIKVVIDQE